MDVFKGGGTLSGPPPPLGTLPICTPQRQAFTTSLIQHLLVCSSSRFSSPVFQDQTCAPPDGSESGQPEPHRELTCGSSSCHITDPPPTLLNTEVLNYHGSVRASPVR